MKAPARITVIMLLLIVTVATSAAGDTLSSFTDTIKIFKHKSGVRYRIYKRHWFHGIGIRSSYGWSAEKMNKQDSIVMINTGTAHYFKMYGRRNRLILEGQQAPAGFEAEGRCKVLFP